MDEAFILLLVASAIGKPQKEACAWAGLTTRKATTLLAANDESYQRLFPRIRDEVDRLRRAACDEVKSLSEQEYKTENERLLGLVAAVRRRILEAGVTSIDVDALALAANVATDVEQRQLGKPKQISEVKFQGSICVWNPKPLQLLKRDEMEMIDAQDLITQYGPQDVLEGEVIEAQS